MKKLEELSFCELRAEFLKISDQEMISESFGIVRMTVHLRKIGQDPFTFQFETENHDDEILDETPKDDIRDVKTEDATIMEPTVNTAESVSRYSDVLLAGAGAALVSFSLPLYFSFNLADSSSSSNKLFNRLGRKQSSESADHVASMLFFKMLLFLSSLEWMEVSQEYWSKLWPPDCSGSHHERWCDLN